MLATQITHKKIILLLYSWAVNTENINFCELITAQEDTKKEIYYVSTPRNRKWDIKYIGSALIE